MSDPFDTGELPPGLREEYLAGMRAVLGVLAAIGDRLAAAGNDREALEMLQREAHKIRGSAGSYGFMDASRLSAGMEVTAKDWVAHSDDREVDRGSLTRWFVARLAEMLGLQVPRPPTAAHRPLPRVGPPPRPSQAPAAKPIQPPRALSRVVRAPLPPPHSPAPTPAPAQRTPAAAPPLEPRDAAHSAPPAAPTTGKPPITQVPPRPPARPQMPTAPAPAPPRPKPKAGPPAPSPAATTELPWILSPKAAAESPRPAEVEPAASAPPAEPAVELPAAAQPEPPPAAPSAPVPPLAEAPAVQPEAAPAKPEPAPSASLVEPVAEAPGAPHPPTAPQPPLPGAAPVVAVRAVASDVPEVIFVEDDAALAELLAYGLRARGYRFAAYRNGRDALRELIALDTQGNRPLLLLDVDLPALDGYSIFAALQRERPGTYRVVFTTVHGSEEEQLRGLEAGALDYLVKPISLRVALEKIKRWVGR